MPIARGRTAAAFAVRARLALLAPPALLALAACGRINYRTVPPGDRDGSLVDVARADSSPPDSSPDGAPADLAPLDAPPTDSSPEAALDALDVPDVPDAFDVPDALDALDALDVLDASVVEVAPPDEPPDAACPTGTVRCGGACVNTTTDRNHCGLCGQVCPAGAIGSHASPSCVGSSCALACDVGFGNCDGVSSNGCEVDFAADGAHCGACGTACAAPLLCTRGACLTAAGCMPGFERVTPTDPCTDIDECATLNGGCGAHAACTNTPGARACACDPGWRRLGSAEPFACEPTPIDTVGPPIGMVNFSFNLYRPTSANGRFLAFVSASPMIVAGDTNGRTDVFIADRSDGTYARILSNAAMDQPDADSSTPTLSGDGAFVGYISGAFNLVPGFNTRGRTQIYLYERATARSEVISLEMGSTASGANENCNDVTMSDDGTLVFFSSAASNLTPGDFNNMPDVFVRDRATGVTRILSRGVGGVPTDGPCTDPFSTRDGRFVGYLSTATNIIAGGTPAGRQLAYVVTVATGATVLVGSPDGRVPPDAPVTWAGPFSRDGDSVTFDTTATNLVTGDTNGVSDVFVFRRSTRVTTRVSVGDRGEQAGGASFFGMVADDPRWVVFSSDATNLVPGDTNGFTDSFVRDTARGRTYLVSHAHDGALLGAPSQVALPSDDGRLLHFITAATNVTNPRTRFGLSTRVLTTPGP